MNFLKWMYNHIDLMICIAAFIILAVIFIIYMVKISKAKKYIKTNCMGPMPAPSGSKKDDQQLMEEFQRNSHRIENLKPSAKYIACLICAVVVVLLPVFVPLKTVVIIAVCGCGDLGTLIVLRDRYDLLK